MTAEILTRGQLLDYFENRIGMRAVHAAFGNPRQLEAIARGGEQAFQTLEAALGSKQTSPFNVFLATGGVIAYIADVMESRLAHESQEAIARYKSMLAEAAYFS